MAYLNVALAQVRTGFSQDFSDFARTFVFDGTMDDDGIQVKRDGHAEFVDLVRLTFVSSPNATVPATLGYLPSWRDHSDGQRYPGHLEFNLPASPEVASFLGGLDPLITVHIGLRLEASNGGLSAIGPDEGGYWVWDSSLDPELGVELDRIFVLPGAANDALSAAAASAETNRLATQVSALASLAQDGIRESQQHAIHVLAQVRQVRLLLAGVLVALLVALALAILRNAA